VEKSRFGAHQDIAGQGTAGSANDVLNGMNFSLDPMTEVTTSRQCGLWPIWREGEDRHRESILHLVVFFARTALSIDIQPQDPQKVLTCVNWI